MIIETECSPCYILIGFFFSFNSPYFINIGNHDLYPGRPLTTARPEEFRKTLETSIDLPS